LWTVVLAAGGARRLGRHKLLRRIGDGSLLSGSVRRAAALTPGRCVVVLGCAASRLRHELAGLPVRVVVNRGWRHGMAGSLQAGIASLPVTASAALVVLADQYALRLQDLRRLAAAWSREPRRPAAAWFAGRIGAPAILPRAWFPRVAGLTGDAGARSLLRHAAGPTTIVAMPGALPDLDTPEQLEAFRRHARRPGALSVSQLAKPHTWVYIA
jgi:molybdenum cofactor cytidylyltransferase